MFGNQREEVGLKLNVFSIYDKKAQAYFNPFYFHYKGEALRSFETEVNNPQSPLSKYPADFALYRLGVFNSTTGCIEGLPKPEFVSEALDFRPVAPRPEVVPLNGGVR